MDGFVPYMPDLEVCIMYNPMANINGIEQCPKLEFFECYSCNLKDISPLAACTELKHLNVCYNNLTDISPLYGLTKLERLWIARNPDIPADQIEHFKELVPGCEVNTTTHNPTRGGWRYFDEEFTQITPRYELLRQQFRYEDTTSAPMATAGGTTARSTPASNRPTIPTPEGRKNKKGAVSSSFLHFTVFMLFCRT